MIDTTKKEIATINLVGWNALHIVSQHISKNVPEQFHNKARMFDVELYISSNQEYPERQRAIKEALDINKVKYSIHPKSSIPTFENDKYKNISEVIKIQIPDTTTRIEQISDIRKILQKAGSTIGIRYANPSLNAIRDIGNEDTREAVVKAVNDQYRAAKYMKEMPDRSGRTDHSGIAKHKDGGKTAS